MSEEEEAVTDETEAHATHGTEEGDPQEDKNEESYESLLAEFDAFQSEPSSEKDADSLSKDDLKEVLSYVKSEREKSVRAEQANALKETVTKIKGDLEVPEEIVEGLLHARANKNPKLSLAYQNRETNPNAWAKIEKSLNRELKEMIENFGKKTSEQGKKRVAQAVRNASTENPEVKGEDIARMSNVEFSRYKQKLFAKGS